MPFSHRVFTEVEISLGILCMYIDKPLMLCVKHTVYTSANIVFFLLWKCEINRTLVSDCSTDYCAVDVVRFSFTKLTYIQRAWIHFIFDICLLEP